MNEILPVVTLKGVWGEGHILRISEKNLPLIILENITKYAPNRRFGWKATNSASISIEDIATIVSLEKKDILLRREDTDMTLEYIPGNEAYTFLNAEKAMEFMKDWNEYHLGESSRVQLTEYQFLGMTRTEISATLKITHPYSDIKEKRYERKIIF